MSVFVKHGRDVPRPVFMYGWAFVLANVKEVIVVSVLSVQPVQPSTFIWQHFAELYKDLWLEPGPVLPRDVRPFPRLFVNERSPAQ